MRVMEGAMTTTFSIGSARVTILNAGDMRVRLAEEYAVPEALWRPDYVDVFEQPAIFPSLSVYVELQGVRALVDINDYRATVTPDSSYALPDYIPPPPIPAQLAALGAQPEDINHVIITHAHWDHYAGATSPTGAAAYAPTFPQARFYLGAADWRDAEVQRALQEESSLEARTLGVLWKYGLLHLVEAQERIAEGIDILPAPGETPGHQVVRIQSDGETLFIMGDLLHHTIEVTHPEWMVSWAEAGTMRESRRWLFHDALARHAALIAAHIPRVGHIEQDGDDLRWHDR
jgi:glyoxylase-like metal-dependent hydrolase (beta-lactamase superfamily II)